MHGRSGRQQCTYTHFPSQTSTPSKRQISRSQDQNDTPASATRVLPLHLHHLINHQASERRFYPKAVISSARLKMVCWMEQDCVASTMVRWCIVNFVYSVSAMHLSMPHIKLFAPMRKASKTPCHVYTKSHLLTCS